MRIAPEGRPFIVGAWVIAGAAARVLRRWVAARRVAAGRGLGGRLLPRSGRDGPRGDNLVIAPADGMVVERR